jgi:UDP-N-acetylmuramoyl-L-alanyl-D-glutamate--2,6-diaminopimelate ligase
LNADAPEFQELAEICRRRGHRILSYGEAGEAIRLIERRPKPNGQALTLEVFGRRFAIETPLVGDFQAANLMAALGLVLGASDVPPERAAQALDAVRGAPGRLQRVDGSDPGFSVFIDYAHTPDALAHALEALRPHVEGALSVVFGCGGDRDSGKRPAMGKIAVERADRVFITDDNPRSEEPAAIRRQILAAAPGAIEIADRAEAIHLAVRMLGVGDVLVVAGKGHETGQIVGSTVLPFDDAAVAKAALAERFSREGAGLIKREWER